MMLIEETQVGDGALPVSELETHLRLGTGFSGGNNQDEILMSFLRAAMAAIEGWTDKALISRNFVYSVRAWKCADRQPLPVAPVSALASVKLFDATGASSDMAAAAHLMKDTIQPEVLATNGAFDAIPKGGVAEIRFTAGYGETFTDVPADLRQAVLLLAAHYYEYRDETALSEGCMPFGVTALLARYRRVRLGMGA